MNSLFSNHVITTTSHGELGGRPMDTSDRLNTLDEATRHRIKAISSACLRADTASKEGNDVDELRYLLYAVSDISGLPLLKFDDRIDDCTAYEYADSLFNGAERIKDIFERGWE